MIRFENRETHKQYAQLMSSMSIDFMYFNEAASNLVKSQDDNDGNATVDKNSKTLETMKLTLNDLSRTITTLNATIAKITV